MVPAVGIDHSIGGGTPGALPSQAPSLPRQANLDDQARFHSALSHGQPVAENPPKVPALDASKTMATHGPSRVMAPSLPTAVTPSPMIGDAILQGLDRLRASAQDSGARLQSVTSQQDLSPQELIKLQMQVSQTTFNQQMIGQVAGKLEQDIDVLMKSS